MQITTEEFWIAQPCCGYRAGGKDGSYNRSTGFGIQLDGCSQHGTDRIFTQFTRYSWCALDKRYDQIGTPAQ